MFTSWTAAMSALVLYAGGAPKSDAQLATVTVFAGSIEEKGACDGKGEEARFNEPWGLGIDGDGILYVADHWNFTVRRIRRDGTVETYAGEPGDGGHRWGVGRAARFNEPTSLAVDADGNVYLAIYADATVRKINLAQEVTTLVGEFRDQRHVDGPRGKARLVRPVALTADPRGGLWVVDACMVKKVDRMGLVRTVLSDPTCLDDEENGSRVEARGKAARFKEPGDIVVDRKGNLFISDWDAIVKVTPAGDARVVARGKESGDSATEPEGFGSLAVDEHGTLYGADGRDLWRVAKNGKASRLAQFSRSSHGVVLDSRSGDLFVAAGHAILRVHLPR